MTWKPVSVAQFRRIVHRALNSLPVPLKPYLINLEVAVWDRPDREDYDCLADRDDLDPRADLLGLFVGVPLTDQGYGAHHPNVIKIFRRPLMAASATTAALERNIRATVLHELAHHFGFSEEDLEDFERRQGTPNLPPSAR
jgi:predicted Zn-dependent protease with MMP-like domain